MHQIIFSLKVPIDCHPKTVMTDRATIKTSLCLQLVCIHYRNECALVSLEIAIAAYHEVKATVGIIPKPFYAVVILRYLLKFVFYLQSRKTIRDTVIN